MAKKSRMKKILEKDVLDPDDTFSIETADPSDNDIAKETFDDT